MSLKEDINLIRKLGGTYKDAVESRIHHKVVT